MSCGEVVEEGEKTIEVNVLFHKATSIAIILDVTFVVNRTNMAENIFIVFACIPTIAVGNYSMHAELSVFTFFDKMGSHC